MTTAQSIEHRQCRLTFELAGQGPPVLLIQGVGVHGSGWQPQVEALSRQYHCLTFDNRGIGKSQPRGNSLTVTQMAEDALALMDANQWPSAHIIGHSLGGLVALHLALSAPARARSLALLCTFAQGRDPTRLSLWMIWVGLRTRIGTPRQRRHAFLKLVMPAQAFRECDRDATAARLAVVFGHDLGVQPPVAMQQLQAMRQYDATPRLAELAGLPTLVVSAAEDRIARPEFGRKLATGLPGARYVEIDQASHGLPLLLPDTVNSLLFDHLSRAETRLAAT